MRLLVCVTRGPSREPYQTVSTVYFILLGILRTDLWSQGIVSTARSPIILWRLWYHKPSHKHDSNKYQSKTFVICDHKSDETRSVTHVSKAYLVWLMFWVLSNQHYQHRTNQKLRSWTNAVFQNREVCGQAFPSFPSPSPVIPFFFCSLPNFLDELARKRLLRRLQTLRTVRIVITLSYLRALHDALRKRFSRWPNKLHISNSKLLNGTETSFYSRALISNNCCLC